MPEVKLQILEVPPVFPSKDAEIQAIMEASQTISRVFEKYDSSY